MHMSDYLEQRLIDETLRGVNFAAPANIYLALATSGDDSYFAEVTNAEYGRRSVNFYPQGATSGLTYNSNQLTYPEASGSWGTISLVGLYDAATNGNQLYWGPLTSNKVVASGNTFVVNVSGLSVQLF